ncbi:hypothetical protein [Nocardiopsis kunsanensis]|uniref:Uncharacterized protein n=1 Tax=Nocardiopsis kunsanensis TaxID=141693 RepID=A0A919CLI3_9ACTN|nr:hypothetical protein [Nocardiopsis kunsanensis]GHD36953.1 hypothetical protein GCM10007147_44650 [Nocardiopsis kunsanensis]
MNLDPPPPAGLLRHELTPGQIEAVLEQVFTRGVRCGLLDHPPSGFPARAGEPQWLLAELGDGRVTGACPHERWRLSDLGAAASSASVPGPGDRWRILEVLVFTPHAQIRLGEGGEHGWLSADAPEPLPAPLRPRDRAFLLRGHNGPEYRRPVRSAPGHRDPDHGPQEPPPLTLASEPDGTRAVLPLDPVDTSGTTRPLDDGSTLARTVGMWLTVREYWAEDPATGAVGVAFHRLTGLHTGPDPAGPGPDPGTGDPVEEV